MTGRVGPTTTKCECLVTLLLFPSFISFGSVPPPPPPNPNPGPGQCQCTLIAIDGKRQPLMGNFDLNAHPYQGGRFFLDTAGTEEIGSSKDNQWVLITARFAINPKPAAGYGGYVIKWDVHDLDDLASDSNIDPNGNAADSDNSGEPEPSGHYFRSNPSKPHGICPNTQQSPGQEGTGTLIGSAQTHVTDEGAYGESTVRLYFEDVPGNDYSIDAEVYTECSGGPLTPACKAQTSSTFLVWRRRKVVVDYMTGRYPLANKAEIEDSLRFGFGFISEEFNKAIYTDFIVTDGSARTYVGILYDTNNTVTPPRKDLEWFPRHHCQYPSAHPDYQIHLIGVNEINIAGANYLGVTIKPHTLIAVGKIIAAFPLMPTVITKKTINHEVAHALTHYGSGIMETPEDDHTTHSSRCAITATDGSDPATWEYYFCPLHVAKLRGVDSGNSVWEGRCAGRAWAVHEIDDYSDQNVSEIDSGPLHP